MTPVTCLPDWFKQKTPDLSKISPLKELFSSSHIHTVCEQAHCPNMNTCWDQGVATFMILGDICTRACRFCAVKTGHPLGLDPREPEQVVSAVQALGLRYVVMTSVTRDDLADQGAEHFAKTVSLLKEMINGIKVEALIPDFWGHEDLIGLVTQSGVDVLGHNMETVQRFHSPLRPQASYQRSLSVLKTARRWMRSRGYVKSGFMVGLGETVDEINQLMRDLIEVGCDMLTIGQYLAPSKTSRHVGVDRFVSPEEFDQYKQMGLALGFKHVFSGPLVRSSYLAEQGFHLCQTKD
jgi:lipoyl synthase